jgi:hypothetical protein
MTQDISGNFGRRSFLRRMSDMVNLKRNLYDVLGYPYIIRTGYYAERYARQDIAHRIINAYPDAIWGSDITVQDDGKTQELSEFELSFERLATRLNLFQTLNRLDKLAGLGRYAVLLMGIRDGLPLSEPADTVSDESDLLYIMPFSELNARIHRCETYHHSVNYGKPLLYSLKMMTPEGQSNDILVHHTRVLHIAEGALDNDVFGVPRLEPVYNRLLDLEKVVGGSAEIFWLNGRGGLSLNADKDVEIGDPKLLEKNVDDYINSLVRFIKTRGVQVKPLNLSVHSPDKHVSVILDLISGATGIPKRILVGSERGELASTQDSTNWMSRVKERCANYCEPLILRPFIQKLIALSVLPSPTKYSLFWGDSDTISELDKATIAHKKAQALATYVNSQGGDLVIPPKQFVEEILKTEYREDDLDEIESLATSDSQDDDDDDPDEGDV